MGRPMYHQPYKEVVAKSDIRRMVSLTFFGQICLVFYSASECMRTLDTWNRSARCRAHIVASTLLVSCEQLRPSNQLQFAGYVVSLCAMSAYRRYPILKT